MLPKNGRAQSGLSTFLNFRYKTLTFRNWMQSLNQEIYRKIWLLVPSWKIGSAGALGPPSHLAAAVQVGRL